MITVVLFGLVMAVLMNVIVRQQRFYRGANDIIDTRTQIRQAASVLPLDLRAVSSIGADIKAISDSSITVLATIGTSIICATGASEFVVPPENLSRHTLTSWHAQPVFGDSAFIYDEGGLRGSEDDSWQRVRVDTVVNVTSGCGIYLNPNGSESSLVRKGVRLGSALSPTVIPGAVVRFVRPVRYRFYRAGDANWYLGYEQYVAGAWGGVQPLAGPYRPYDNTGATSGLRFRYFNESGTAITSTDSAARASIARIDLQIRGVGTDARNIAQARVGQFRDSLLLRIAIRNRD
jgi:hypothetical protein